MDDRLRAWAPDLVLGVAVLVLGLLEITTTATWGDSQTGHLIVIVAFAVACGLARREPLVALVIVWATCALQLLAGTSVLVVEFTAAVVAFGCARWGRIPTVVASGLSIPAAAVTGYLVVTGTDTAVLRDLTVVRELLSNAQRYSGTLVVGAVTLGLLALAVPWLAGLVLRATARAHQYEQERALAEADAARAQYEAEQAREIARLRVEQATLARDVHDVVGHSLTVILAQAESGQYLADDDPVALKRTLATIAVSARSSLQDVRHVLAGSSDHRTTGSAAFEELLDGIRRSGHEVVVSESGRAQPLPPELDVVVHRVAQEMLTNAIKHGTRDQPVRVSRQWPQDASDRFLCIEVGNATSSARNVPAAATVAGQGLEGMRRRLDVVGGRLEVTRGHADASSTFTATAWVPVTGR